MTKSRYIQKGITMILVAVFLLSILPLTAAAAPITDIEVAVEESEFSIDIIINESTDYAGIEFALTISDESAVTFKSFTNIPDGASAAPFMTKGNLHYFGFFSSPGANVFSADENLAGTLNFTGYTSDKPLTITVVDMTVTRVNANKQAITTIKDSPSYTFLIQREGTQTDYFTVTFDTDGGERVGGGTLEQIVNEGGAAVAPELVRSGYIFNGWDGSFSNVTDDITVTAQWEKAYTVTFRPDGGTRTGGGTLNQTIPEGGKATAPIVERNGYTFKGWDKTFDNVTSDMIVTAQWSLNTPTGPSDTPTGTGGNPPEEVGMPNDDVPLAGVHVHFFDDVTDTLYSWAEVEVCALAEAGVVNGTSYRIYSPAANIKRGDFTLMLARAYGIDDEFTENFQDVPAGSYYYDAIGSARIRGIAKGYSDVEFRPEAPMLRQEMMSLIDRTLSELGKPLPRGSVLDLDVFSDRDLISDYALDSVAALVKSGIIQGSGGSINPLGYTTRAEMACALYRLMIITGELAAD